MIFQRVNTYNQVEFVTRGVWTSIYMLPDLSRLSHLKFGRETSDGVYCLRPARVLAAGLAFGAHGKRERESPEVTVVTERLQVELPELPDDVLLMAAVGMVSDDPCGKIWEVCLISTEFANLCRSDGLWKLLCEVKGYDREDYDQGYDRENYFLITF